MARHSDIEELQWCELLKGMTRHFEVPLTPALLDRFAECSGDYNPLHVSKAEALRRGFPGRVAHGMLLGSLLSCLVGRHLPGRFGLLLSVNLKFHHPCIEGDLVRVEGVVENLSESTQTIELRVKFTVDGQLRASATALVAFRK